MVARQNLIAVELLETRVSWLKSGRQEYYQHINGNEDKLHLKQLAIGLLTESFDTLFSMYTLGANINELSANASNLISDVIFNTEVKDSGLAPDNILEQYIQCTWILSFAYFFNAAKSDVKKIIQHIPYMGKDKLIDRLIAAIIPEHPVSQEVAFPDVYKPICDAMAVYDKDARDVLIQLFLKKYYPSLKKHDVTWYDSHKEKDPEYNFHTGYWVFELAAVAVTCGWDDADFRDNMYYPKDLADWKLEQLKQETL